MSTIDKFPSDDTKSGAGGKKTEPTSLGTIKAGLFNDVEVSVTVHLGEAVLTIAEICELKAGSVVTLGLRLNEPATLFLKDKPIARGEIVAVDENFALRITEIAPVDRS